VGYYDKGKFVYAGKVGTVFGCDAREADHLMMPLAQDKSRSTPALPRENAHY